MVIDTLQLDIIVNNKNTSANINSTTKSLKTLYNTVSSLNDTSANGSSTKGLFKFTDKLRKAFNIGSIFTKLYYVRNVTKQLGQDLAQIVKYGIDYEETLNLWQTAMRGNISQAKVFVSEMTKAYGISTSVLMNYQATFKNMLAALGNISEDTAYGLSEALTQMALDFSSLYNVSVEAAMTKFQAVLSGQVRPIRTAGYDITEQTLFTLYKSIGGTKTVRQLNQTEKQLLRILAVYKQMERSGAITETDNGVIGDLAKTITSSSNQFRIMKEQAKEFATWVGVAFNVLLEKSKILITINGYLYALVAVAKAFATQLGYVEKDYTIGMDWESIDNANKAADELQGKLLGFDKFQVLTSAGADANIEKTLLDAVAAYKSVFDKAENPAFEKSLELLKAMGFELDENGNIIGGLDKITEKVKEIEASIAAIVLSLLAFTKPASLILVAFEYLYWTSEDFRESITTGLEELSPLFAELSQATLDLFVAALPIAKELISFLVDLAKEVLPTVTATLSALAPSVEPLAKIFNDVIIFIVNILRFIEPLFAMSDVAVKQNKLLLEGLHKITQFLAVLIPSALIFIAGLALVIFEPIYKVFETIRTLIITLFTWDWKSLGNDLDSIWSNWTVSKLLTPLSLPVELQADGGLAQKGSLFYAGEAGPELVTQTSGGGSTIMNMKQLEDAVARGMIRGFMATDSGNEDNSSTAVYVDGQRLFEIMRGTASRNGYRFAKVGE